jgi:hypothetical protein
MFHHPITRLILTRLCPLILLVLLGAATASATVTLEWDPNDPAPEGYRLFRRLAGEAYDYNAPLGTVTGTRYEDDTIVAGETYHYVVRAFEGADESGDSNEVSYTASSGSSGGADDDLEDEVVTSGYPNDDGDSADDTGDVPNATDTVTDQETPNTRIGLTPLLSATMSDAGQGHAATRWQISLDADFSQLVLNQLSTAQLTRYAVPDMVLETETVYYWRAIFLDAGDRVLVQSSIASFETVAASNTDDLDSDGLVDTQEVGGGHLDLDGNGVNDTEQTDMACVATDEGDAHIGLKVADSGAMVVGLKSVCPTQIANTRNLPEMTDFGAVSFKLYLQAEQSETTVTIYFSEPAPEDTDWFKYDPELGWQLYEDAEFSPDRRSVSYTLIDGGRGDDDGVANGIIIDPAGLGYRQTADTDTHTDADTSDPVVGAASGSSGSCFIATAASASASVSNGGMPVAILLILLVSAALMRPGLPRRHGDH